MIENDIKIMASIFGAIAGVVGTVLVLFIKMLVQSTGYFIKREVERIPENENLDLINKTLATNEAFKKQGISGQLLVQNILEKSLGSKVHEYINFNEVENTTSIINTAKEKITDKSPDFSNVNNAWFFHFIDKAKKVGDRDIQDIWARILADEIVTPGTFSLKTINILSIIEKSDAILFTELCSYVWKEDLIAPFIRNIKGNVFDKSTINYANLTHLDDLGLIHFSSVSTHIWEDLDQIITMEYFDKKVEIHFKNESNNHLDVGEVSFTQSGLELFNICKPKFDEKFYQYTLDLWIKEGLEIIEK